MLPDVNDIKATATIDCVVAGIGLDGVVPLLTLDLILRIRSLQFLITPQRLISRRSCLMRSIPGQGSVQLELQGIENGTPRTIPQPDDFVSLSHPSVEGFSNRFFRLNG